MTTGEEDLDDFLLIVPMSHETTNITTEITTQILKKFGLELSDKPEIICEIWSGLGSINIIITFSANFVKLGKKQYNTLD